MGTGPLGTLLGTVAGEARYGVNWATTHGIAGAALRAGAKRGDLHSRLIVETRGNRDAVRDRVEALRAEGGLQRSPLGWTAVSHEAVRAVLNSDDFISGMPEAPGVIGALGRATTSTVLHPLRPPSLLVTDAPDHTRYRKLVTGVFTMRAVERMRESTRAVAESLLDALESEAHGEVDLVARYCALLPVTVIAEILGVPVEDRAAVLKHGTGAAPSLDMGLGWREYRSVERSLIAFDAWMSAHIERIRREPGDDFLSQLVLAHDEKGGLSDVELRGTASLVLGAGFETTVNLLGNGITLLSEHREQRDHLLANPDGWANATEEVLRHDPPVLLTGRRAKPGGAELLGKPVRGLVTAVLWGANHDPAVFADPHTFDVTRANAREHISFSSGRHHCLGAQLARMEGEIGLRALFERFPDLSVLEGARRRRTRILCGWERLPVRLAPSRVRSGV